MEIRGRFDEDVESFSRDQAADADDDAPVGREAEAASGRVDRLGVERMKALRIDTGRNDHDLRHRRTNEAARLARWVVARGDDEIRAAEHTSQKRLDQWEARRHRQL